VELLVVVVIVGILAALAFPALSRTKSRAQTAKCVSNVQRLLTAIQLYTADNNGQLPYSYYSDAEQRLWWHQEIAPYAGFSWEETIGDSPWDKKARLPDIFHCPADPWWGKTYAVDPSYGINHQLTKTIPQGGYPAGTPRTRAASVPNPATMLMLADTGHSEEDGDVAWRIGRWQDSQAPLARHNGFGTVGWMDGHVTMESAARLKEIHKEPAPFPHWQLPP
jgi:prepilin-type processing-associated H-X9-DG protein